MKNVVITVNVVGIAASLYTIVSAPNGLFYALGFILLAANTYLFISNITRG